MWSNDSDGNFLIFGDSSNALARHVRDCGANAGALVHTDQKFSIIAAVVMTAATNDVSGISGVNTEKPGIFFF